MQLHQICGEAGSGNGMQLDEIDEIYKEAMHLANSLTFDHQGWESINIIMVALRMKEITTSLSTSMKIFA